MWKLLQGRATLGARAAELYGRVVAQAREPGFYARIGVSDTPEGRYEVIVLHLILAIERLRVLGPEGHKLGRALNERFVTDMDDNLREMGVGDMTVPKKVKRAAAGLLERADCYGSAMATGERARIVKVLAEHIPVDVHSGEGLACYVQTAQETLAGLPDSDVLAGQVRFPHVP